MEKNCPKCNHLNTLNVSMPVAQYVCANCKAFCNFSNNQFIKEFETSKYVCSLKIGQKGIIEGTEYTVVAIVIRKTGSYYKWAEYYLKDKHLNDVFLSESAGHWVFMKPLPTAFTQQRLSATYKAKRYRKYETTQCTIETLQGFFQEAISFGVAQYSEYVNGENFLSCEIHGKEKVYYFEGRHFPNSELKKAFQKITYLPFKSGYGIVQPFLIDIKQLINVFVITAILMSLIQLYQVFTRSNVEVFKDAIRFDSVIDKELISNSFQLNGASAPLAVKLNTNVDNSWANVELSLVNETTNEIEYASKDIEQYHGYEGGESWSEGSTSEEFNFCGVAPGKYHFAITAQKQGLQKPLTEMYYSPDGAKSFEIDNYGFVIITQLATSDKTSINLLNIEKNNPEIYKELQEAKKNYNPNAIVDTEPSNPTVTIVAEWKPVSLWNYFIILLIMAVVLGICYFAKYTFEKEKWSSSANSPYPDSNDE